MNAMRTRGLVVENQSVPKPASGWPYPGTLVWCKAASGGHHPVRLLLSRATMYNDGGQHCERCNSRLRSHCGKLQHEMAPKEK
jgi:hypothetical protein